MGKVKEKKILYIAAAVAAAVVAVIALAVVLFRGGREETYRSIRIVELEGSVTIDRESVGSLEASVNMNLVSGDHVTTSAGAYVVLRLDEDKYVMLGEQGGMKVEADGDASKGRTAIHLEAGSVLSEIQNPLGPDSTYEIVTPNATMSVRGTVFEARRNGTSSDGNIEVLVYEGKVAVGFEDQELVLYGGGEYAQFTAGETPRFLVERSAIKEELMNSQMLKRLQQINESGRSLDFGEADMEELIGQENSDSENLVADNSQAQEFEKNDNLPNPEFQDPTTAEPSPDVTETEAPASTEHPRSSDAPAVTSKPSAPPAPAVTPKPSATPAPAATSKPSVSPSPAASPKPSADPTQPPASTKNPTPSDNPDKPGSGKKCTVEFYIPIIESVDDNNIVHFYGSDGPDSLKLYDRQELTEGSKIAEPEKPTFNDAQGASSQLDFVGWYTEQNEQWDFANNIIEKDMKLYPVWKNKDDNIYYYPVILSDPQTGYYRCRSVRAGSYLFDQSADSEEYENNNGNGCPTWADHKILAWRVANSGSENNNVFWKRTQTVQGVTSLLADWR